jgi:hypothetical protein
MACGSGMIRDILWNSGTSVLLKHICVVDEPIGDLLIEEWLLPG